MSEKRRRRVGELVLVIAVLPWGVLAGRAGAVPQSRDALTRTEVVELLEAGVPPKRVEILARERGIAFELTRDVEQTLRRAGATPALMEALRELGAGSSGLAVLMIESRPGGAQVFVDDELMARTSSDGRLKLSKLSAGSHAVRVSLEGFPDFEETVVLQAGKTITVAAHLEASKSTPAILQIESNPGKAAVYVDDEFIARTSTEGRLKISTIPSGRHRLRVSAENYADFEQTIDLGAGKTLTVTATLNSSSARKAGAVGTGKRDGLKYVWIPPGTFTMGCSPEDTTCWDNERPAHPVTLSKGFWIGQTEVTVDAYKRFVSETGKVMPGEPIVGGRKQNDGWEFGNYPMVAVSWDEAVAYCKWAGGRLPTEAEWEYAARAGNPNARFGVINDIAWYGDNSGPNLIDSTTIGREAGEKYSDHLASLGNTNHAVGQKQANAWGLFDTIGGVWEWANDWFDPAYFAASPSVDPHGPASGTKRAERGGSWLSTPVVVRVSRRDALDPAVRWTDVGFRCALDAGQ